MHSSATIWWQHGQKYAKLWDMISNLIYLSSCRLYLQLQVLKPICHCMVRFCFHPSQTSVQAQFLRQRWPGNRRTRGMGDDCHGWTDLWYKNICYGREVPGVWDAGYLLLNTWTPLCTVPFADAWSYLTMPKILLPWRCTRSMCNVSPAYATFLE